MLGLEGRRDSSAAPVCREPEQSRAMGNSCLPAAAEKGAQPFQRVGVRLVRIGDHLALKPGNLFQAQHFYENMLVLTGKSR